MSLPLAASGPLSDTIMPILIGPFWAAVGTAATTNTTVISASRNSASILRMRNSPLPGSGAEGLQDLVEDHRAPASSTMRWTSSASRSRSRSSAAAAWRTRAT